MQMLGNITTKLAAHEVRMDDLTSCDCPRSSNRGKPSPSHETAKKECPMVAVEDDQDLFHGMEKHEQQNHRAPQGRPASIPDH